MNELTPELKNKARGAGSAEELYKLAKAEGFDISEDDAKSYYAGLHKSGELSDEELDNVAGGGCNTKDGRLVVTVGYSCENWVCKRCGSSSRYTPNTKDSYGDAHYCNSRDFVPYVNCNSCKYMSYERGLWLCNRT